ncbi:MAG: hypothetical protein Q7S92_00560 [Candidatus Diapherotrites archaeon]|nr:hypothetical protein [Candidatus Diapherotrites archaeon]
MNEKIILCLGILLILIFGCTQANTTNLTQNETPRQTYTVQYVEQHLEELVSNPNSEAVYQGFTIKGIIEDDHFKESTIKFNIGLSSMIYDFQPEQEYEFTGTLFKNEQGQYEFWATSSNAPPYTGTNESNTTEVVKSTAQTEGQLIQDLVKAIKASFELN